MYCFNSKDYHEAIKWLNDRTKEYDEGNPTVSDKEWDDWYFEVVEYEKAYPHCIQSDSPTQVIHFEEVSELKKVKHNHPMLSLNKTKDIEEVESFIDNKSGIAMAKMDGLTCSLFYDCGKLVRAETRGDGEIGEDITHNAMVINSIPKRIRYKEPLTIDGEIICDYKTFEIVKAEAGYKNPRNYAAGSIRLLDNGECYNRKLTFVAWDIINKEYNFLSEKLDYLKKLNFKVVPYVVCAINPNGDFTYNIEESIELVKEKAERYYYPIDGVVFKYDNIEEYEAAGRTDHHFKGGLAYKFYDEEYETRLCDIEWSMGRTGQISPVAVFEPIDIDGTIVKRCSLFNLSVLEEKLGKPYVGQKIWICKRNMIIPYIERAEKS